MDLVEVGEAALGEGPEQVEGGGRLVVGVDQPAGIGLAGLGREARVVDDVAAERRELHALPGLGGRRAGFGELPGDAPHLDHRDAGAVGEHDGHLEDDPKLVPDGVGRELEGLGAVTRLQQDGPARCHLGQGGLQGAGFAGEDQRRLAPDPAEGGLECVRIRPLRLLGRRFGPPRARRPDRFDAAGHILGHVRGSRSVRSARSREAWRREEAHGVASVPSAAGPASAG